MQEIEKLKVLQSERESLKSRTKQIEQEKKAENQTETICPECGGSGLSTTVSGQNWSARVAGW